LSRSVPNSIELLMWNFRKKIISGEFLRTFVHTKAIIYQNLWNFTLLSAILFCVHIALEKLTQVLLYVLSTQLRRHVHKQITKRRYRKEKPGRFVFGNPILFTLGLGLTTPYSFGLLVWNFYQTFVIVCIEFWLRFEPHIRPTGFAINVLFITARAERKSRLCVKLFDFFPRWILIRLTWSLSRSVPNSIEILTCNLSKKYFGRIFQKFCANQGYPLPKFVKFRRTFWIFIIRPYCVGKTHTSTFICGLHSAKEARP